MQAFTPRPYQQRAVDAARASWRAGKRAIVLVAPTGAGKTALSTMLGGPALSRGEKVYFIVHREELMHQARSAFSRIGVRAGIIAAGAAPSDSNFQIVSLQTAVARKLELSPDLAIIDECHHVAADEWSAPIRSMRARDVGIVGLTATPDRGDGRGLGGPDGIFDDLIVVAQPRDLIRRGFLVPCRVMSPPRARKSLAEHPVRAWQMYARGRKTITFSGTVSYARKLADEFSSAGIRARCVDGKMAATDRARAIAMFRSGELEVLTSVNVLTEGFDVPETSCVITTTGASAPAPLIQKVGRGMRPAPGKADCLHLDLRGAWRELGMLPEEDRAFSLDGRAIMGGPRERGDVVAQCRGCGCSVRANEFRDSVCPYCGHVRKGREDPRVRKARMAIVSNRMPQQERTRWLADKIREGRSKRKKDGTPYKAVGWALQQFTVKFRGPGGRPQRPSQDMIQAAIKLAGNARQEELLR